MQKPLLGRNLTGKTLTDIIQKNSHMLLFLRHLGCSLGKKLLHDIKETEKSYGVKFPITFVSQGSKNFNENFWDKSYPDYSVIYDTDLTLAKSFGLREGTVTQVLNPSTVYCTLKAMGGGFLPSGPKGGNIFMMPAVFVYIDGKLVFSHIAQFTTDMPDFEEMVKSYLKDAVAI
jgi:hypothetical protein